MIGTVDHPNEPGTDKSWTLAVKRGRDAREPRVLLTDAL